MKQNERLQMSTPRKGKMNNYSIHERQKRVDRRKGAKEEQ